MVLKNRNKNNILKMASPIALRRCCAPNCERNSEKDPETALFLFPRDRERFKTWLQNTRSTFLLSKAPEQLRSGYYICADHFEDCQFINEKRSKIKWSAVPTLFHLCKKAKTTSTRYCLSDVHHASAEERKAQSTFSSVTLTTNAISKVSPATVRSILKPLNMQLLQKEPAEGQSGNSMETHVRMLQRPNQSGGIMLPPNLKAAPGTVVRVYTIPLKDTLENKDVGNASTSINNNIPVLVGKVPELSQEKPIWKRFPMHPSLVAKNIAAAKKASVRKSLCTCICKCRTCQSPALLKAKLSVSQEQLRNAQRTLKRWKAKVQKLKEKKRQAITERQLIEGIKLHLSESVYEFIVRQFHSSHKKKQGMRWSSEIKDVMLKLYRDSPYGYRMLGKLFDLPSTTVLLTHEKELKELVHLENELLLCQGAISETETRFSSEDNVELELEEATDDERMDGDEAASDSGDQNDQEPSSDNSSDEDST